MLIRSIENKQTYLAWPSGEWSESLYKALQLAGVVVEGKTDRNYAFSIPAFNIVALICRATDVPQAVQRKESKVGAGITGTDIIEEYELSSPDSLDNKSYYQKEYFPIRELVPTTPEPDIRWGVTPNAVQRFGTEYNWDQLTSGVIFTPYPNLVRKKLKEKVAKTLPIISEPYKSGEADFPKARIETSPGKIEGLWRLYTYNYLIADIVSQGKTAKENDIKLFGYPLLREICLKLLMSLEKLSYQDLQRLLQLRDVVASADIKMSGRDD